MKKRIQNFVLVLMFLATIQVQAQWVESPSFPVVTDGAFAFTIENTVYVNGGLTNNDFYSFNELTNQWTQLADVPSSGSHLAWAFSFSINGKGYIAGGSYEDTSDLEQSLWEYNPQTNEWTQKADFPGGPRDGGYSFAIGGKGYIGGGFEGQFLQNDLYEYDPDLNEWNQKSDFPGGPVIFPASFVINEKAYVGTGAQGTPEIQDLWEYDPATDSWDQKTDFPGEPRQTAGGFSIGDRGYIGGGMSGYSVNRTDFWEYDPASDTWEVLVDADYPAQHTAWSTCFVLGTTVYFGLGVSFPEFTFSNAFYKLEISGSTGIGIDISEKNVSLYPMPVQDVLNIDLPIDQIQEIKILDLTGKIRYAVEFPSPAIDLSRFASGLYFIEIITNTGIFIGKVVKV